MCIPTYIAGKSHQWPEFIPRLSIALSLRLIFHSKLLIESCALNASTGIWVVELLHEQITLM